MKSDEPTMFHLRHSGKSRLHFALCSHWELRGLGCLRALPLRALPLLPKLLGGVRKCAVRPGKSNHAPLRFDQLPLLLLAAAEGHRREAWRLLRRRAAPLRRVGTRTHRLKKLRLLKWIVWSSTRCLFIISKFWNH